MTQPIEIQICAAVDGDERAGTLRIGKSVCLQSCERQRSSGLRKNAHVLKNVLDSGAHRISVHHQNIVEQLLAKAKRLGPGLTHGDTVGKKPDAIENDALAGPRTPGDGTEFSDDRSIAERLSGLTPRQREVLLLVCDGLRNGEIAARLGMTEKTVKAHVSAVLAGLGALNRTQAATLARRGGLLGKPS